MLVERATVCWGYMPYGWLGPVSNGLSPFVVVAKLPVELTDARCANGEDELVPRLCTANGLVSCGMGSWVFAVLFRVAMRRRSVSGVFEVEVCRCGASCRS